MPELPEVETIRRDLAAVIIGKKITDVTVLDRKPIKGNVKKFIDAVKNKTIKSIDRIGKLIMIDLGDGHRHSGVPPHGGEHFLLIHLKMTGQLIYQHKNILIEGGHSLSKQSEALPNTYSWIIWIFNNGGKLYFNDMRKFGYVKIVDVKEKEKIVATYGPEPLTKNFTLKTFLKILEKRNAPIKALLLNQALVAGIGNIYADEVCFEAGIFPGTRAGSLNLVEKTQLFKAINKILKKAIKYKGTTFKNYRSLHGKKGNFSDFLQVYKRDKQSCFRCLQGTIANKKIGGRSSRYCPVCQKVLQ